VFRNAASCRAIRAKHFRPLRTSAESRVDMKEEGDIFLCLFGSTGIALRWFSSPRLCLPSTKIVFTVLRAAHGSSSRPTRKGAPRPGPWGMARRACVRRKEVQAARRLLKGTHSAFVFGSPPKRRMAVRPVDGLQRPDFAGAIHVFRGRCPGFCCVRCRSTASSQWISDPVSLPCADSAAFWVAGCAGADACV